MPAPPPSPSSRSRRCARNLLAFLSSPPFFLPGLFGRFRRLVVSRFDLPIDPTRAKTIQPAPGLCGVFGLWSIAH